MENFCFVPESRRYWVIRSEKGRFLNNFREHGLVAIGHLDDLDLPSSNGSPFKADWATLRQQLIQRFEALDQSRRSAYSVAYQSKAFVEDIKEDDWVVVPSGNVVAVGRVAGPAKIEKESLFAKDSLGNDVELKYDLRREVSWGPLLYRGELSSPLRRSLAANQTLFNIDGHWEALHHAMYGAFARADTLYLTARLTSDSAYSNIDVITFLSIFTDIEVVAKGLSEGLVYENFDATLHRMGSEGRLSLTTKAEFYSPGDVWVQLVNQLGAPLHAGSWIMVAVTAYNMVFGNSKKGWDGVLDLDTRHKIRDIILRRIEQKFAARAIKNLGAIQPSKNTDDLEPRRSSESK